MNGGNKFRIGRRRDDVLLRMVQNPEERIVSDRRQITLDAGIKEVIRFAERRPPHIDYRREERKERQLARTHSAKVDRFRAVKADKSFFAILRLNNIDSPKIREDASHFVDERVVTRPFFPFLRGEKFREVVKILLQRDPFIRPAIVKSATGNTTPSEERSPTRYCNTARRNRVVSRGVCRREYFQTLDGERRIKETQRVRAI